MNIAILPKRFKIYPVNHICSYFCNPNNPAIMFFQRAKLKPANYRKGRDKASLNLSLPTSREKIETKREAKS